MTTLEFTIRRVPEDAARIAADPDLEATIIPPSGVDPNDDIEYWVYEEVQAAKQKGNYVVITMADRSAFVPTPWIVQVREIGEKL